MGTGALRKHTVIWAYYFEFGRAARIDRQTVVVPPGMDDSTATREFFICKLLHGVNTITNISRMR